MQLYYVVGSPNCRKVHAVANHLGLRLDFEYLDFFAGEHKSPEYLAVNPNGMVPTLVDGDLKLSESNAITQYLAEGVPGNVLLPQDRKARADIARWLSWEGAHFNKAFGILAFEAVAKPNFMKMEPDAMLVKWAQADLGRFAPILESALQGRRYLVGEAVTLADYAMIHLETFKEAVPFNWKPYANVNSYFARISDVPHWASTAPSSPQAIGRRPG